MPADLRIFSYLPNPRVWKSLIAADLLGAHVDTVGAKPAELAHWLWDFDARPLAETERSEDSPYARTSQRGFSGTLYKTDEFLEAHPFGTVPAAFSPDGSIGIFESNAILRAVARSRSDHDLYGRDAYETSRVDSFLDADLVFAREAQVYLLGMKTMTPETHNRMAAAHAFFLAGVEQALSHNTYLVGDILTIADIAFVCDFTQFLREAHYKRRLSELDLKLISEAGPDDYPRAYQHLMALAERAEFAKYLADELGSVAAPPT